jgi:hypothetical protein
MDPISLIVTALAAGASAAVRDTASQAVKDGYTGLKAVIMRKLGSSPTAKEIIERHEEAPEVWEKPLAAELEKAGVGDDDEVIRLAEELMAKDDPAGARAGKYKVTIVGSKGVTVGDHAHVEMTFTDRD